MSPEETQLRIAMSAVDLPVVVDHLVARVSVAGLSAVERGMLPEDAYKLVSEGLTEGVRQAFARWRPLWLEKAHAFTFTGSVQEGIDSL